jgi:transcriptional antiterminator NusG
MAKKALQQPFESVAKVRPVDFVAAEDPTQPPAPGEPLVSQGMNWFVLRVASNQENSVQRALIRKVRIEELEHCVNRILVPTEKVKVTKNNKLKVVEEKLYPGYVFVEMRLEKDGKIPQDLFFLIKETTGVGDFIGTAGRPTPMMLHEVEKMLEAARPYKEQAPVIVDMLKGDHVEVIEGAFAGQSGMIDDVDAAHNKVKVLISVFGRATSIEMDIAAVRKVDM